LQGVLKNVFHHQYLLVVPFETEQDVKEDSDQE